MNFSTKEELTRRPPLRTHTLHLRSGHNLKVTALLPEIRARFPLIGTWDKLVLALQHGVVEPQLSAKDAAAFLNAFPLDAAAAGKKILELSSEYDHPRVSGGTESEHFLAALEGIASLRGER